jgi:hypothetical protein
VEDETVPSRPRADVLPDANLFLAGRIEPVDGGKAFGSAVACAAVTAPLEPDTVVPFYAELTFADGDEFAATGTARVLSADVPEQGVILAGCSLRLVDGPPGLLGGALTSASVFNPARREGVTTGSIWTLLAYFSG